MRNRARLLLSSVLLLALGTVLAACNAGQSTTLTAPEIVRKVRDTMRDANTAEGTVQIEVTLDKAGIKTLIGDIMNLTQMPKGGTGMALDEGIDKLPDKASADLRIWKENPDKGRVEVDSSTLPGMKGAALVSDGTKVYAYTPLDNTVRTASIDALEKAREAMKDRGSSMMGPGMSFLSGFEDPEVAFDKLLDASDVVLLNEEKVNGRDAYKLEATPKSDAATRLGIPVFAAKYAENIIRGTKGTLWVDKALFTPLKATLEHPSVGTLTYTGDLKLNGPIDADRFVLQVPPGAKVEDMDPHLRMMYDANSFLPKTATLDEARDVAEQDGWKPIEPTYLPQGATLVNVSVMPAYPGMPDNEGKERRISSIALSYSSPLSDFSIHQMPVADAQVSASEGSQPGSFDWLPFDPSSGDPTANSGQGVPGAEPQVTTEQIKVRGVDGSLSHITMGDYDQVHLSWVEADGSKSLMIVGKLTKDEMIKIAEGLK
jgi:outer membrane lipoprotein-sorting protein